MLMSPEPRESVPAVESGWSEAGAEGLGEVMDLVVRVGRVGVMAWRSAILGSAILGSALGLVAGDGVGALPGR